LEHASGDWVLVLDCDEELCHDSRSELKRLINLESPEAFFIQIINTTDKGMELKVSSLRLFRNKKAYRYTGRIHEQILPSITKNGDPRKIMHSNIEVLHFGYNPQLVNIPAKIQRNLKILEQIPEKERDGFYYYNLGTEYLRLGRKEEALAQFLKAAPLTHPGQGYGPIMIKRIITILLETRRFRQALNYLQYYRGIYPDFNDLVLLTGLSYFMCGHYSKAQDIIKEYLELPPAPPWYPTETSFVSQPPEVILDMATKHAVVKDYPPLSVIIIGNNEAATLGTCIKSVNEIASQVIYVDTGSTDDSREIAFELGAEVHSIPWEYNYSSVRNYALNQARGEWILVLDADEVLPETSIMPVINAVKHSYCPAYLFKITTPLDQNQPTHNYQLSGSFRLFRRGARYQGALAQQLLEVELNPDLEPIPDLEIIHLHFQAPIEKIINKRKILEEVILREWPDNNPMRYYLLGREAFYAQEWFKAADYFKSYFKYDLITESAAYYYYTLSLINIGEYTQAIMVAEEGQKAFPDYTDLFYLQGIALGITGQLKSSETLLLKCLQMGDAAWWKYLSSPGTGHYKALLSLGTIYVKQHKYEKAIQILLQAAKIPQSSREAIEHLVKLHEAVNIPVEILLQNQGLYNWTNLLVTAQTYAKMGKRLKSWEYLQLLKEQKVVQPECIQQVIGVINTLLLNIKGLVTKYIPDHPILNKI